MKRQEQKRAKRKYFKTAIHKFFRWKNEMESFYKKRICNKNR